MSPIKIALIGPKQSGKTKIANIITGNYIEENTTYEPTVGVRILPHFHEQDLANPVETEIWDCSGDQSYENCWPAILQDLHGVIVCFDPTSPQQVQDSRIWAEWFALQAGLHKGQIAMFSITEDKSTTHQPFALRDGTCNVPIANVSTVQTDGPAPAARLFTKIIHGIQKARQIRASKQQQQ